MRHEVTSGGAWTGPVQLGNPGPVTPAVTVVRRNDGRLQLFALRSPVDESVQQDVITSLQADSALARATDWTVQVHSIDPPHPHILRSIELMAQVVAPALGWQPATAASTTW